MKAIWKGTVLADSDDTVLFEGEHYFPAAAVKTQYLLSSNSKSMNSLAGETSYYTVFVDGDANPDAAWFYANPKEAAAQLAGRIAFRRGVQVLE